MTIPVRTVTDAPRLVSRTIVLPDGAGESLIDLLPADSPLTWLRNGDGLVAWGEAALIHTRGETRFSDAEAWWADLVDRAEVHDLVKLPGTGLLAFGSFAFAADSAAESVLTVPAVLVGRRGPTTWLTTVGPVEVLPVRPSPADPGPSPEDVTFSDGSLNGEQWMGVIAEAVARIDAGELDKVVLARDLIATAAVPVDVRTPLRRLTETYPTCWTFHVDGLFGATPEMLVRRERGLVTSRVLAGTIRRTGDDEHDLAQAATLARSSKDLEEHEYAVRSVADALDPHCSSMNVPEVPFVLHLPNVMHLATDVNGVASDEPGVTSLTLAAALHPSAAVGGTPTAVAVDLIGRIEGMDRGRYAGPVGWMDASGDGEWGIALRSAFVSGNTVRLFAGCGIVAGSDPASELAESQAKFLPVRDALA